MCAGSGSSCALILEFISDSNFEVLQQDADVSVMLVRESVCGWLSCLLMTLNGPKVFESDFGQEAVLCLVQEELQLQLASALAATLEIESQRISTAVSSGNAQKQSTFYFVASIDHRGGSTQRIPSLPTAIRQLRSFNDSIEFEGPDFIGAAVLGQVGCWFFSQQQRELGQYSTQYFLVDKELIKFGCFISQSWKI